MQNKELFNATERLFDERKNFIVIGLTGRTGSGCSTVANMLTKDFAALNPPKSKENDFDDNEQRKYNVIYKYSKENWSQFILIEFKSIITLFLLQHNFDEFLAYIKNSELIDQDTLDKELTKIKTQFDKLHLLSNELKTEIENDEKILGHEKVYNLYFIDLPKFAINIQTTLKSCRIDLYTILFQRFANNIRTSGTAYNNEFNPNNIFSLAQQTNQLIKVLRKRNENSPVLVVIDAFRNPYEAAFFKDRYSAFYLFSVSTSDENRKKRLAANGFTHIQIEELDQQEYPNNQSGIEHFSFQNIQKCIELADIHLYNSSNDENVLKKQLLKYVSLIMHPGLISPTHEERCMHIAVSAKLNSGCLSRQVGATITDKNFSVKAVGWNNCAESQTPCNLRDLCSLLAKHDSEAFSEFEINNEDYRSYLKNQTDGKISEDRLKGRILNYCFKDAYNNYEIKKNQVHTRALHAEENAFLQIVKYGGQGIFGGYLFTTSSPCELCAKKAYQLGIKKVFYIDPYPGISESHVLHSGKNKPEMILFQGAIGEAYHALYTPILPFKDELYMLLGFKFEPKNIDKQWDSIVKRARDMGFKPEQVKEIIELQWQKNNEEVSNKK